MSSRTEQRLAQFAKAQAKLPEALQLKNREDLDKLHVKEKASSTLKKYRSAKRWFIEFLKWQDPDEDASRFFNADCRAPSPALLKKYAIFMGQSRVGYINSTVSVATLTNYMRLLLTVLGIDRRRRLEKELYLDVLSYINNDLIHEYSVPRDKWMKPVAHSEDLSHLLQVLYSPSFLATLPNMRQLLNFTIFINMLVDCGGRGGDIAWDRTTPEGTCLRWEDVKFYAFYDSEISSTDIRANVTFRHLKGMRLDPSQYKTIPFSLFPTNMATEDTLRLLLILAMIDNVFEEGVTSWSDLMMVESSITGRLIPIRRDLLQHPVLRKIDSRKHQLTLIPGPLREMQALIKRLGRAAGLESRLTAFSLRRGVAYTLATKTSADNRRFLMGHKTASRIYSEYASKVATVDLAALYRDREPRSLGPMIGMSLNRRDDAPQSISDAGLARCRQDPEFVELYTEYVRLRDALIGAHGTIAAALRTSDPNCRAFQQAFSRQGNKLKSLRDSVYRDEYREFFEKSGGGGVSSLLQSNASRSSMSTASEPSRATSPTTDDPATPSSAASSAPSDFLADWILGSASSNSTMRDMEYEEDGNVMIDPVLLQMDLTPSDEQDLIDQLEAVERDDAHSCSRIDAQESAATEYDRLFPYSVPCDFKKVRKVNGFYELYDCGRTFTDRRGFGDHVRAHITGNNSGRRP